MGSEPRTADHGALGTEKRIGQTNPNSAQHKGRDVVGLDLGQRLLGFSAACAGFEVQQSLAGLGAAGGGEAGGAAGGGDYSVAWDDQWDRVGGHHAADGAGGAGVACEFGQLAIGQGFAVRDRGAGTEDRLMKGGAAVQVELDPELGGPPVEVAPGCHWQLACLPVPSEREHSMVDPPAADRWHPERSPSGRR